MILPEELVRLGAALALGLLIGTERGWSAREARSGTRVAGLRTFALLGLLGGVAALVPPVIAVPLVFGAAFVAVIGYQRTSAGQEQRSATTAIAELVCIGLGALAGAGQMQPALAAAAVVTLILAMRHQLHAWLKGMSEIEIDAAARFAVIALAILPLMPNHSMGPLEAWNPRQIWLIVVLVSGLSFAGYALARRVQADKGALVTAAFGALVSSTAVTVAFAETIRRGGGRQFVAGIALASVVMFVRAMLLTGVLAPSALVPLAAALVPAALVGVAPLLFLLRKNGDEGKAERPKLGNPLALGAALGLALLVAVLSLACRWAIARFGNLGAGFLLLMTGLADVDAAIITFAGLPKGAIDPKLVGPILAAPMLANTLLKAGLAVTIAGGRRGWSAAAPLVLSTLAAVAGLVLAFA